MILTSVPVAAPASTPKTISGGAAQNTPGVFISSMAQASWARLCVTPPRMPTPTSERPRAVRCVACFNSVPTTSALKIPPAPLRSAAVSPRVTPANTAFAAATASPAGRPSDAQATITAMLESPGLAPRGRRSSGARNCSAQLRARARADKMPK